jgi:hypothetical protein
MFNNISQEEKNRILKMHSDKKRVISEQSNQVNNIVQELISATKGLGTNENVFLSAVKKINNYEIFNQVNTQLKSQTGKDFVQLINSEFESDNGNTVNEISKWLTYIKIRNQPNLSQYKIAGKPMIIFNGDFKLGNVASSNKSIVSKIAQPISKAEESIKTSISKAAESIKTYVTPSLFKEFHHLFGNFDQVIEKEIGTWFGIYEKIPLKRVVFVAPGDESEEGVLNYLKKFSIINFIVNSVQDILDSFNLLEKRKGYTKQDEIVIGSHGNGKALFLPKSGTERSIALNSQIVEKIRNNIHANSTVYFTACYAANDFSVLQKLANDLNHPVYGASGVNIFGLASTEGHYKCSPSKNGKTNCEKVSGTPINWIQTGKYV